MKKKEAGFRIRDSGRELLPADGSLPDANEARRGRKVHEDRNRSSLLDYSTFDSRLLTEQTWNVYENKGRLPFDSRLSTLDSGSWFATET
jgi:hypothetical protein